jgi:hypothetical protein
MPATTLLLAGLGSALLLTAPAAPSSEPTSLAFRELLASAGQDLHPSDKAVALNGQRVRLVGFMAHLEIAPRGAFYLAPRPVSCDEAGGGTADLPPEAVYVVVRSAAGEEIEFTPRVLEVTGRLEVGNRAEPDGRVTHFRLVLDRPQDIPTASTTESPKTSKRTKKKSNDTSMENRP